MYAIRSYYEALNHAGYECGSKIKIIWTDSEGITEENVDETLKGSDGILIPGGFGNRGIEGKILAAGYARKNNVPFLGICLGMQIAVIEFARSVCGMKDANSGEFDNETPNKVIDFMPDQNEEIAKGGTMRLGSYPCKVADNTMMRKCYQKDMINERHRHRYEFNNNYRDLMIEKGLVVITSYSIHYTKLYESLYVLLIPLAEAAVVLQKMKKSSAILQLPVLTYRRSHRSLSKSVYPAGKKSSLKLYVTKMEM